MEGEVIEPCPYPTITPCPICGHSHYGECTTTSNVDGRTVLRCRQCYGISMVDRKTTAVYDKEYVASRYDKYDTTGAMSRLRLQVIESVLGRYGSHGKRLLDVGYGNGGFIRTANAAGWDAYGYDVNPTEYEGVNRVPTPYVNRSAYGPGVAWDVVTFFDSLEHIEDLQAIREATAYASYVAVSCPAIPGAMGEPQGDLTTWKHYRPGEHHYHFTPLSLQMLFSINYAGSTGRIHKQRAYPIYIGHPEDAIRGTLPNGEPNIMTVILKIL